MPPCDLATETSFICSGMSSFSANARRLCRQRAGPLRGPRGDIVHQAGIETVIGLQPNLLQLRADAVHAARIDAGFDDRGDEGGEARRGPAVLLEALGMDEG